MNLLIVHSRSSADHKPYHIPAIHDIVLSSTLPPLIINGERVMYLTAEIRRSLYSPSTSLRIENDQTRPGGLSFSVRPHQHTRAHVFIQPNERTSAFPARKALSSSRETIGQSNGCDHRTRDTATRSIRTRPNMTMNYWHDLPELVLTRTARIHTVRTGTIDSPHGL